jgi:hypothetical protein
MGAVERPPTRNPLTSFAAIGLPFRVHGRKREVSLSFLRTKSPTGGVIIETLIANRRLPIRRIGGRVLVPVADLRKYARGDHPEKIVA